MASKEIVSRVRSGYDPGWHHDALAALVRAAVIDYRDVLYWRTLESPPKPRALRHRPC